MEINIQIYPYLCILDVKIRPLKDGNKEIKLKTAKYVYVKIRPLMDGNELIDDIVKHRQIG